jgi:hypothetical protein
MGYKDLLSHFSLPTNEDTRQRLLDLGSNIKENILWAFFSPIVFKKKRKDSNTTQTSFLILNAKEINSTTTIDSSSIKFCRHGITSGAFLTFKTMDMVEFKTSFSNQ